MTPDKDLSLDDGLPPLDERLVEKVMNAKLPCGQYVFEAIDKAECRAIVLACRDTIAREAEEKLLRELLEYAYGWGGCINTQAHKHWVDAHVLFAKQKRGISLTQEEG